MKCRRFGELIIALSLLAIAAPRAQAIGVSLTIDSSRSTLDVTIGLAGGAATGSTITTVTGSLSTDMTLGPIGSDFYTYRLQFLSADASFTDGDLVVSLGPLGEFQAAMFGVGANLFGGPLEATSLGAPGASLYNPGGTIVSIDRGSIAYEGTGSVGGLLGSNTFSFFPGLFDVEIPSAPNALRTILAQNKGPKGITLILPIRATATITTDPVDVTASLVGTIIATGIVVPEPATLGLLALGVCGLVPVIRRRVRKSD